MKPEQLGELKTRPFWRKTEVLRTQAKVSIDAFLERDDYVEVDTLALRSNHIKVNLLFLAINYARLFSMVSLLHTYLFFFASFFLFKQMQLRHDVYLF